MASSDSQQQTKARIAAIRRLVHDQPALAVRVVREWLASDGANTAANTSANRAGPNAARPAQPAATKLQP